MEAEPFLGRHRVVEMLTESLGSSSLSLDVGCGDHAFGDINIDVVTDFLGYRNQPSILASALNLPFRRSIFERVYMLDVMEHLPRGTETTALSQVNEALKSQGYLILSVPNDKPRYTLLDPAYFVIGHRHYRIPRVVELLEANGYSIDTLFTAGGLWVVVSLIISAFAKILLGGRYNIYSNSRLSGWIKGKDDEEHLEKKPSNGYSIFCVAKKNK